MSDEDELRQKLDRPKCEVCGTKTRSPLCRRGEETLCWACIQERTGVEQ